jgi:hypothetical protein
MLSNDFAAKHDLCGYGTEQFQTQVNRDVKEIWHDPNLAIGGTILMWIASRAQYEKKELIRCCADLTREVVPQTGAATASAEACIQTCLDWCEGKSDRQQVDAAVRDCLTRAKDAAQKAGGEAERMAWSALAQLGRCIRSVSCCSGLASAVTASAVAAGEKAEVAQQRLADLIRKRIPWDSLESTIRANKTSPDPRKKKPDEVSAETQKIVDQFEQLLKGLAEAQNQKTAAFTSAGTSAEKIRGLLQSGRVGPKAQALIDAKAAELDAADAQPAESSKTSAAPPRRPRMTV